MIGFILALLYVAYSVLNGVPSNEAVVNTFGFLWTWHVVWSIVIAVILVGFECFSFCCMVFGNGKTKAAAAAVVFFAIPLVTLISVIRQTLFFAAIALFCKAGTVTGGNPWSTGISDALPWSDWSVAPCVIGGLMYLFGIYLLRHTKVNFSKSDD